MKLVEERTLRIVEFTQEEFDNLLLVLDLATFEKEENVEELSYIADELYTDLKSL